MFLGVAVMWGQSKLLSQTICTEDVVAQPAVILVVVLLEEGTTGVADTSGSKGDPPHLRLSHFLTGHRIGGYVFG